LLPQVPRTAPYRLYARFQAETTPRYDARKGYVGHETSVWKCQWYRDLGTWKAWDYSGGDSQKLRLVFRDQISLLCSSQETDATTSRSTNTFEFRRRSLAAASK